MEKVAISVNLINGILDYLQTRPYREVSQLIGTIGMEVNQYIKEASEQNEKKS